MNVGSILSRLLKNTGDDVANKIGQQYSAANISKLAASSADDIAATQGNLIATHQLWPEKLAKAADLGGFVQPSMAVVDPSKGTNFLPGSGFGDIVMVPNRDAINPAVSKAKTFIGDRDIYSPRFPQEEIAPNMDELASMIKGTTNSKQFALQNLGLDDDPKYSYLMQELYKEQNPALKGLGSQDLREMPEFTQFADDAFNRLRGDRQYVYRTASGAKKTLPATAENANKLMNKDAAVGSEKGWQTPYTSIYHQNTKRLGSLDSLYKNRYRLIDSQTGNDTESAIRGSMSDTIGKLIDENPSLNEGFSGYDTAGEFVADMASGKDVSWGSHIKLSDELRQEIDQLGQLYKEVPVSYFEAKPRRVVGGNEFYGAYIPDNSSPEVIEQLNRLGVTNIKKYLDPDDLDLQLAKLAKEGKRGIDPYVLGLGGVLPTAGILSSLLGGKDTEQRHA